MSSSAAAVAIRATWTAPKPPADKLSPPWLADSSGRVGDGSSVGGVGGSTGGEGASGGHGGGDCGGGAAGGAGAEGGGGHVGFVRRCQIDAGNTMVVASSLSWPEIGLEPPLKCKESVSPYE